MDSNWLHHQKKYEALVEKVRQMRSYQQAYFRSRDHNDLKRSKALEKEVDNIINPKPEQNRQGSFFNEDFLGR